MRRPTSDRQVPIPTFDVPPADHAGAALLVGGWLLLGAVALLPVILQLTGVFPTITPGL